MEGYESVGMLEQILAALSFTASKLCCAVLCCSVESGWGHQHYRSQMTGTQQVTPPTSPASCRAPSNRDERLSKGDGV